MSEEKIDNEVQSQELIHCDSLVKIYKSEEIEVMALQGLDLIIRKGELLSIIGKSGSGKSTLMNIIGGLEKPTLGKVIVDGKVLSDFTEKEMVSYRKKTVGFVWQKSARNLFDFLTSKENVVMAMSFSNLSAKEKEKRAQELLDMAGILHKKDAYPKQMSGGEQQRVAIAVALANYPDILLADEPTGAVDSKTADAILKLFRNVNQRLGITIIIVTHDPKIADSTDRVLKISDGKISMEKVMKESYKEMLSHMEEEEASAHTEGQEAEKTATHEEYSILDKANRVQLTDDLLREAGIDGNKVRVKVEDGKLVISGE